MAFTVTNRGYAIKSYASTDSVSDTFTPAAGSLLLVVAVGWDGIIDSISGHGTWSEIFSWNSSAPTGRSIRVWACIVGSSPSSGAITCVQGYQSKYVCEFYEISGADTSGTVAQCFGVNNHANSYKTTTSAQTLTLSSFASSSNLTFAVAYYIETGEYNFTWSDGTFTTGTKRTGTYPMQAAWLAAEDTTVVVAFNNGYTNSGFFAFEVKAASEAPSGNPWYYYAQQ